MEPRRLAGGLLAFYLRGIADDVQLALFELAPPLVQQFELLQQAEHRPKDADALLGTLRVLAGRKDLRQHRGWGAEDRQRGTDEAQAARGRDRLGPPALRQQPAFEALPNGGADLGAQRAE